MVTTYCNLLQKIERMAGVAKGINREVKVISLTRCFNTSSNEIMIMLKELETWEQVEIINSGTSDARVALKMSGC